MNIKTYFVLLVLTALQAYAIPQYTLLTGNRCINCHVNVQGGGLRNELGWYSQEGVGLIKLKDLGLGSVEEALNTNTLFDGKLTLGFDFRMMSSRSLQDTSSKRKLFPMQAAAYASVQATSWLMAEGQYNAGPLTYTQSGQQSWSASVNIQPTLDYPQLRVGFFQPSLGIRYDDHTMLSRRLPADPVQYLFAPNYAEWGAELSYYRYLWFSASGGIFTAKGLKQTYTDPDTSKKLSGIIKDSFSLSLAGRIAFTPKFFEDAINTNIGASVLHNGDFSVANFFVGIGWTDHVSLMAEYMMQGNKDARQIRCISAEMMVRATEWLYGTVRAEHGTNNNTVAGIALTEGYVTQYLFGAQIFLFPFLEIRPEYRLIDNNDYSLGRWTVQAHIFY